MTPDEDKERRDVIQRFLDTTDIDYLFASSNNISGEFFLEGLDIRIQISAEEEGRVVLAQKIALNEATAESLGLQASEAYENELLHMQYRQVQNHEMSHFYQVMALPAFQIVWVTRYNRLRLEAALMLRYFECHGVYDLTRHKDIAAVLDVEELTYNDDALLHLYGEFKDGMKEQARQIDLYLKSYHQEVDGNSLFTIIESMAHVMSLQLSDRPDDDPLKLSSEDAYFRSYKYYLRYIHDEGLETRWKHLLYIYICYFSCQHFDTEEGGSKVPFVHVFNLLCSRADNYLQTLKKLFVRYEKYNKFQLLELNRWNIAEEQLQHATEKQISAFYAFMELVEFLETSAFPEGVLSKELNVEPLKVFFDCSRRQGFEWKDKYFLAKAMILPVNFVTIRDVYAEVMAETKQSAEFTYKQEAEFYSFIMRFKHLLNPKYDVFCCDKHGVRDNRSAILRCRESEGLANKLSSIAKKNITELVRIS